MIDTDAYEKMTWETPSDELEDAVENLLAEVKRLRKQLSEAENVIQYALDMTSDDDAKSVFEDFLEVNE